MSTLLKDLYSPEFYDQFSVAVKNTIVSFDKKKFIKSIFTPAFESFELKARMAHTAHVLHQFLPTDFDKAAPLLIELTDQIKASGMKQVGLECMFIPEYIYLYGIDHYKSSVVAMEHITQFTSCEFAIRPFILKYEDKMIPQMLKWSKHKNHHVRRLSTEGCRPRLPWAMALPSLKKDPTPILPILENLKADTSEYVRRSVANNLNDISKDNPDIVLKIAKQWKGLSIETDAIIKHGFRTLLKSGHPKVLAYYQLNNDHFKLDRFTISTPKVRIGDYLSFECSILNTSNKSQIARLEYAIYYLKKNGLRAKKVFKISERNMQANETVHIKRKQSFKLITTRVFYPGKHQLSFIVNGKEGALLDFNLLK